MLVIVGAIIVLGCVFGTFVAIGGNIGLMLHLSEYVIIIGATMGAAIIGNPGYKLKGLLKALPTIFKGSKYQKKHYLDILACLGSIIKLAKTKGFLAIEAHVEDPHNSPIFEKYPVILKNTILLNLICEHFRLISMGMENPYHIDDSFAQEIKSITKAEEGKADILSGAADAFPAIGIVAAVLGVILSMGAITEPPEVLGGKIGAALVGTFLGILLSYGFVGPLGHILKLNLQQDHNCYHICRIAIVNFLYGYAAAISIEIARKSLPLNIRPSFNELETALSDNT